MLAGTQILTGTWQSWQAAASPFEVLRLQTRLGCDGANAASLSSQPTDSPTARRPHPPGLVELAAYLQSLFVHLSHIIHVCEEREAAIRQPISVALQVLGAGPVVEPLEVLDLEEVLCRDTAADALASRPVLLQVQQVQRVTREDAVVADDAGGTAIAP